MEQVTNKDPHAPCNHFYHTTCLRDLFMTAMRDESLMPPRCCRQEIPLALASLVKTELDSFNAKRLEFSTPDRLYCSRKTCSAFIPSKSIVRGIGSCPRLVKHLEFFQIRTNIGCSTINLQRAYKRGCHPCHMIFIASLMLFTRLNCNTTTCAACQEASHGSLACTSDAGTQALWQVARAAGWARCYRCRTMVELSQGCYHMTCRCRAEFCYLCAAPWKTCQCVQWDEDRLLLDARRRLAR